MKETRNLRIYMDFACPFCYNEFTFMEKVAPKAKADWNIEYYGWELNPAVPEEGVLINQEEFASNAKKLNELGAVVGVQPGNIKYIFNTSKALQLLEEAQLQGAEIAHHFVGLVLHAYYEEQSNIGKDEVILALAEKAGIKNAAEVLKDQRHLPKLAEHNEHCMNIQLQFIPAIEEEGKILLMGALSLEDIEKEFC